MPSSAPASCKSSMTIGIAFPHGLADQVVRQVSRRAFRAEEAARRIHRAERRDAVLLPDGVVLLSVAGRGVHRAGALLEGHVVGQDAERIALQQRMAEDRAFDARALERGDASGTRCQPSFSAVTLTRSAATR